MGTVVKKIADTKGIFRVIQNIDATSYPTADWVQDPDLSAVSALPKKYWKVAGSPLTVMEMDQIEKDAVDDFIEDEQNTILVGTLNFEKSGTCRNKWIGFGSSKSSDKIPFIIPGPTQVTAITFVNQIDSVETDVEIYKNGTKVYTWQVRDKRWAWKTQGLHSLTFLPGDRVGVYLRDQGTNPKHVIVTLHYSTWAHEVGEGGSSTL